MDRRIFTTREPEISTWKSLIESNPLKDIFFTPEYSMLFEATQSKTRDAFAGQAVVFFYGDNHNYIIYPFFKRKISGLDFYGFLPSEAKDWFDIISPYGYSGPLNYITEPGLEISLWQKFLGEFYEYCVEEKILSEFARLNPYIKNHIILEKFFANGVKKTGRLVYVDLNQDESLITKGMDKGNRSSLSRARKSGIEIFRSKNKKEIDIFYSLYIKTMERNKADNLYFFSREFFDNLFRLLGQNSELFLASYKDQIIAASVFIFKGDFIHYYLSGSKAEFFSFCPNNLLLYEAILWAKKQGFKIFNLGGGYKPNDGLYSFKSSFSKTTVDFYTYSNVHNEALYRLLCEAKVKSETAGYDDLAKCEYFPAYRKP